MDKSHGQAVCEVGLINVIFSPVTIILLNCQYLLQGWAKAARVYYGLGSDANLLVGVEMLYWE